MISYQLILIVLIVVAFIFSIFFCACEIAFSTVSRVKVRLWHRAGKSGAGFIEKFISSPEAFLVPILIGNNIANVLYASAVTYLLLEMNITSYSSFEITIYETIILVLFAEILPKIVVRNTVEKAIFILIFPFIAIYYFLLPVSFLIKQTSRLVMKIFGVKLASSEYLLVTKEDIEGVIDEVSRSDNFDPQEEIFMRNVLELNESRVSEIGTHRNNIIGISSDSSLVRLKKLFLTTGYSKAIVYNDNLDNISGVVYAKDLFHNPSSLGEITKDLKFVPGNVSQYSLFQQFKEEKISIAAVIDEFGGCAGIVTMQDILNEIVGKVSDKYAVQSTCSGITYRPQKKILIVNGEVEIDDLNKRLEEVTGSSTYNINEDKYVTVNGFLINYLQRIPVKGEKVMFKNLEYRIMNTNKNKILNFIIYLNQATVKQQNEKK